MGLLFKRVIDAKDFNKSSIPRGSGIRHNEAVVRTLASSNPRQPDLYRHLITSLFRLGAASLPRHLTGKWLIHFACLLVQALAFNRAQAA